MVSPAVLQEPEPFAERRVIARAVAGRYRVAELVSRGGMAAIYRAFDPVLEQYVALKVLAPDRVADEDERGRFRREARIVAALRHPRIVPALAAGESRGVVWYAMPFLPGGTLDARLRGRGRVGHEEARELLLALAEALDYAHRRAVVHRDVKAENVLLDEAGGPMLGDFGVAILSTSEHSRADAIRGYGTPEYMAPEQFLGTPECDGRQDLYALGVLGFRMLTGRFPFEGSPEQIAAAHVTREVPPVASYAAELPETLAAAIDRCLAKRPKDRWRDCAAFARALRAPARESWFSRLMR